LGLAGVSFFASYAHITLLLLTSQRQALKIRKLYLRSLFRQEMGWYDLHDSGELVTHIAKSVCPSSFSFSETAELTISLFGICVICLK